MAFKKTFLVFLLILLNSTRSIAQQAIPNSDGVSIELATWRKKTISNVVYEIAANIPEAPEKPISATTTITFDLNDVSQRVSLDFKANRDQIKTVAVNGNEIPIQFENEHLLIDPQYLTLKTNAVAIKFVAGNTALTRKAEFMYSFFVPERTRTFMPCFDQPDLKSIFKLALNIPVTWEAVSNGAIKHTLVSGEQKTVVFAPSDLISTYLFTVVAGKFKKATRQLDGREMNFYYRETNKEKLAQSLDTIFALHNKALHFLEAYTQIPYPFKKFDFIAIPGFQAGGMEHAGAIDYSETSLFLDKTANARQKSDRLNLIAHETAHMWFGNLVTMRWFNDVWMKEVFANFIADKVAGKDEGDLQGRMQFLLDHYPSSYAVDRTLGTHPIRQQLNNLNQAGSLYGNIIYDKAPIVMNQLEQMIGEQVFKEGVRVYLKKYAFGNADWTDLIAIFKSITPKPVAQWNETWIEKGGRPVIGFDLQQQSGKITQMSLTQQGENGISGLWNQQFEIALVYKNSIKRVPVVLDGTSHIVTEVVGMEIPLFIILNSNGEGYGCFAIDKNMLPYLATIQDPVMRASAYLNLYENAINGVISPVEVLTLYQQNFSKETEILLLDRLKRQYRNLFWQYISLQQRQAISLEAEAAIWNALEQTKDADKKRSLLYFYFGIAMSPDASNKLYRFWENEKAAGIKLREDDLIGLAGELALRNHSQTEKILTMQLERIKNKDSKAKFEYLLPSLSTDLKVRDAYFATLASDRKFEDWIPLALANLHHPLRAGASEQYLTQTLDWLEAVQKSGGVFFPGNWLRESFGYYQSKSAAAMVTAFLAGHPDYNPNLKRKILQETDDLFRASRVLEK